MMFGVFLGFGDCFFLCHRDAIPAGKIDVRLQVAGSQRLAGIGKVMKQPLFEICRIRPGPGLFGARLSQDGIGVPSSWVTLPILDASNAQVTPFGGVGVGGVLR